MGDRDAFYQVFWLLPNAPLPSLGDITSEPGRVPQPVLRKRSELRTALSSVDLTKPEAIRDTIGACDQYIRSLRSAQTVEDIEGESTWSSAIIDETSSIPIAFEEPMTLVLQATLLINLGTGVARARVPQCVSESAHCFCQAAGILEYVMRALDEISSTFRTDVPVEIPELAPRILQALIDMALMMAQQLAVVKAALHSESSYSVGVLQKLHTACQISYESYETAVVRSCYSAHPRREGCATLLGYAVVFSRLHRASALEIEANTEFTGGRVGEAIAFMGAAMRQLQDRLSMRDAGLPPIEGNGGLFDQHYALVPLVINKRQQLEQTHDLWTKDNGSIYFARIPPEESVLKVELPLATIMKIDHYDANTRLGSARMFQEESRTLNVEDMVTAIGVDHEDEDDDGNELIDSVAGGERSNEHDDEEDDDAYGRDTGSSEGLPHLPTENERDSSSESMSKPASEFEKSDGIAQSYNEKVKAPLVKSGTLENIKPPLAKPFSVPTMESRPPTVTGGAKSPRRMATRVQPQKSVTSRHLLANTGKQDSIITLGQTEEQLRKSVTEEKLLKMKRALQSGIEVYRFTKETWKKEVLRSQGDQLVLIRKHRIALLPFKQHKIPWSTIHAFQHELQPVNQVLQLLAPPGQRMTSILVIAGRGDKVGPMEITLSSPEQNACAVACLQQLLQDKRQAELM